MFCPKCGSRVRGLPPHSYCEQTRAGLSQALHVGLIQECIARVSSDPDSHLPYTVGGTWFCPGCATHLEERDGRLSCPTCGSCLNRFVHDLVEFYVHPSVSSSDLTSSNINPLLRAAMSGETEVARAISDRAPAMRTARGANGESPAQLALAAGHIGTAVALFRNESSPLPDDPLDLLQRLMSELSETITCAAWLDELEHVLWDVANSNEIAPSVFSELGQKQRDDLQWLSQLAQGWFRYGAHGPEFVDSDTWDVLHERRRNAG